MARGFRHYLRRTVVVNLRTNKAFRGVLFDERGPLLILKGASLLEPGSAPIPVDGEVLIDKANVDFAQALQEVIDGNGRL